MRRLLCRASVVALSLTAGNAFAQFSDYGQGPLLIPPAPGESRGHSIYQGGRRHSQDHHRTYAHDPRMSQIADWYRHYLSREMGQSEARNWEVYLQQNVGELNDVQALVLGSPEFYERAGGNFGSWLEAIASVTGSRLDRNAAAQWRDIYEREGDRISFTKRFLHSQQSIVTRPGRIPEYTYSTDHDHSGHYGDGNRWRDRPASSAVWPGYGSIGSATPGWLPGQSTPIWAQQPFAGHGVHDHHADHDHRGGTPYTALRPTAPLSESELIADWYRSYFSRDAGPHEVQKWLTDLNKGMPLSEVYASIIAADEWYGRNGSSPSRWLTATLNVLGERPDGDSVGYWMDRYRRHDGNRFRTTMEMVDRYGIPGIGAGTSWRGDARDRRRSR